MKINFFNSIFLVKKVRFIGYIGYMLNYRAFYLWYEGSFVFVYSTLGGAQCNVQKCYEDAGIDLTGLSSMPQW